MKIIINGYVGKKITGIGRVLIETLDRYSKIDLSNIFILYTNYDNEELLNYSFSKNVLIKKIPVSKYSPIKNLLFNLLIFPIYVYINKVDIVFYYNFTIIPFKMGKIVSIIHDMIEFNVKKKFSRARMFYRKLIVPRMAKISDEIITVSEHSKKDIIKICNVEPKKITVIYDAVSSIFKKQLDKDNIINSNYMLYVGTVDYPGKNVFNAISSFEIYKSKNSQSDLKFVIAGMPGKGFEFVEKKIEQSDFKKDILYLGYVDDDKLKILYTYASLFIFISYYEGFGLPILEAMQIGLPVITSNRSSLPEVAGNAAVICDPDDTQIISDAISKILNDDEFRNDLIQKGYENVKRFSWEESSEKILKILKKVKGKNE